MKKIICLALALLLAIGLNIFAFAEDADPVITFKDPVFEDAVLNALDRKEGSIRLSEIQSITELDLSKRANIRIKNGDASTWIRDFSDLKYFTSLEVLYGIGGVNIESGSIDVSNCPHLKFLLVNEIGLKELDVSHNPELEYLNCKSNSISTIDLSNNPNLEHLDVSNMATIIPPDNPFSVGQLEYTIKSIDVSNCPKLKYLNIEGGKISELDLSHNPELEYLNCWGNLLETLDTSKCTKLKYLDASYNGYSIPSDSEYFVPPKRMNTLKSLDISGNTELEDLRLINSDITEIDTSASKKLKRLVIVNAPLTEIDVSENTALETLYVEKTNVGVLDISHNPGINDFNCAYNMLEKLDLSNNPKLGGTIWCGQNPLKELILGDLPSVIMLACEDTGLTSLDLSGMTGLQHLICSNCKLSSLDLSANAELIRLECESNKLTSLDVSKNTELERLVAENNKLTSIDLSANAKLKMLYLASNMLTGLDLTANSKLEIVRVRYNYIPSEVDVLGWNRWTGEKWYGNYFDPQKTADEFDDVSPDKWYSDAVSEASARGIVSGTGNGNFSPSIDITRAMFATILASYDGAKIDNSKSSFKDVPVNEWYTGAIRWANAKGIMNGKGSGIFDPDAPITREEMMTVLCRYAEYKNVYLDTVKTSLFADDGSISSWAYDFVMTMKAKGIIDGKGGNVFAPKDATTRAEAAQILVNYLGVIEDDPLLQA
ncbi:MAG: S-layer homology domain-containing protein [Clostridia bacterium]|nr:S-layer homology domain-containing protein [Clostridia bacterium]